MLTRLTSLQATVQALAFLLLAFVIPGAYAQQGACGPPSYSCSRTDTQIIPAQHPPQLGDNATYYGGHSGVGKVAVDPAYGNPILRATDGNMANGQSFNTGSSAEKNPWSYDEQLFVAHNETDQLCLFQLDAAKFQSTFHGCFIGFGRGGGADFGYTQTDNRAFYNFVKGKLYRFVVDTTSWKIAADPSFNGGKGFFDLDSPTCMGGQIAAHQWTTHDHGLSSDDNTIVVAVGPQQDADSYLVAWNANKGCQWLNVKTLQTSHGWNAGLQNPVTIAWASGVKPSSPGGIHNAQVDRSGNFGIFVLHNSGIKQKMFWTLGTSNVDASCTACQSHWACDYGVCFWNYGRKTAYDMRHQVIGSLAATPDMANSAAIGQWNDDEHASHANAQSGQKTMYLTAWSRGDASPITQVWENEITGISWDGSQRTVRFNKHWSSNLSGFWTSPRCSISHQGHYALCGSDYQAYNMDKGFGNGKNQDTCDHKLPAAMRGTNGCRTDVLVFELR
ncbi:MAG: hypothetical protein JWO91_250 [Acidobacteriaceae bacterium]|nr:hypothetical protein [Acidobacteriaceae bacterium]